MSSLLRRSKWAGVIACLILLMNLLPFGAIVHAEGLSTGDVKPGDITPGDIDPGRLRPGDIQPGNVQWDTGGIQPGEIQPGDVQPGDVQPGNVNPGDLQPGDVQPGNVQPGDVQPGDVNPGNVQPGNVRPGSVQPGDTQPGGVSSGDIKPDNIAPGSVKPGDLGGSKDSKAYEYIKWSANNAFGGSLKYTADLTMQGEVSPSSLAWGRGLFLAELGVRAFDIQMKGTPLEDLSGSFVDGFDGAAGYANVKFISDLRSGLPVTGLVKGLNIAAAGISLVFDGYDTFTNFRDAFDSSKGKDERIDFFIDGTGTAGSTFIDAAVIAAMIPGGQTVAVVLVSVGAALWVGSRLVKWSRKIYKLFA